MDEPEELDPQSDTDEELDPLWVEDIPAVPGERVFHDSRQRWYTVIECDIKLGQCLVDHDGRKVWMSNHHLWRTDEEDVTPDGVVAALLVQQHTADAPGDA